MSRKQAWIILYILQSFNVHSRGNLWNKCLINETQSDATSFDQKGSCIQDLQIIALEDMLTITWNVNNGNAIVFFINWYALDKTNMVGQAILHTFLLTKVDFNIRQLEPCTSYNITVTATFDTKPFTEVRSLIGETVYMEPSAPLNVTAVPIKFNKLLLMSLSWTIPKIASSCVKHYEVKYKTIIYNTTYYGTANSDETSIILSNLRACASYNISITVIDVMNAAGLTATIQSKPTLPTTSNEPVLIQNMNVPPAVVTKNTITFNWNVTNTGNNCSLYWFHTFCQYHSTKGYGFKIKKRSYKNKIMETLDPRVIISTVVENLSPFSKYVCSGMIINSVGASPYSTQLTIQTKEDVPSAPENFRYVNNTQFTFQWDHPRSLPGELRQYRLTIVWAPIFKKPSFCKNNLIIIDTIPSTFNNYTWRGGEGYAQYTAYMEAKTDADWGSKSKITFPNLYQKEPSPVTNLEVVIRMNNWGALEAILSWNLPCSSNGVLKSFRIFVLGRKLYGNLKNHNMTKFLDVKDFEFDQVFTYKFTDLRHEYYYQFNVSGINVGMDKDGEVAEYSIIYPAGIPPQPDQDYLKSIKMHSSYNLKRTPTSVEVLLPLFLDTNGLIIYYAILVSQKGFMDKQESRRFYVSNDHWPNVSSWEESMRSDFKIPYQASESRWSSYHRYILDYGNTRALKIVIGDDIDCNNVPMITMSKVYCNGPLNPNTWYEVRIRAFTTGGYAESNSILVKTEANVNIMVIVGAVVGTFLTGIAIALFLIKKLRIRRFR